MKPNKKKVTPAVVPTGPVENPAAGSLPPVFPQMLHRVRPTTNLPVKAAKRDNTFSQSRDTREDRGGRQMKTSHNAQTFPHAR